MLNIPYRSVRPGDILDADVLLQPFERVAELSDKTAGVALKPAPESINLQHINHNTLNRVFISIRSGTTGQFDTNPVNITSTGTERISWGNGATGALMDFTQGGSTLGYLLRPNQVVRVSGHVNYVRPGSDWLNDNTIGTQPDGRFFVFIQASLNAGGSPDVRTLRSVSVFDMTTDPLVTNSSDPIVTPRPFRTYLSMIQCPFEGWGLAIPDDLGDAQGQLLYLESLEVRIGTLAMSGLTDAIRFGDWNMQCIIDSL